MSNKTRTNVDLTATLERCKDILGKGKNEINTAKSRNTDFSQHINKVTTDISKVLQDLKKHLTTIKKDGSLNIADEKIEVVYKRFFPNDHFTNGNPVNKSKVNNINAQKKPSNHIKNNSQNKLTSPTVNKQSNTNNQKKFSNQSVVSNHSGASNQNKFSNRNVISSHSNASNQKKLSNQSVVKKQSNNSNIKILNNQANSRNITNNENNLNITNNEKEISSQCFVDKENNDSNQDDASDQKKNSIHSVVSNQKKNNNNNKTISSQNINNKKGSIQKDEQNKENNKNVDSNTTLRSRGIESGILFPKTHSQVSSEKEKRSNSLQHNRSHSAPASGLDKRSRAASNSINPSVSKTSMHSTESKQSSQSRSSRPRTRSPPVSRNTSNISGSASRNSSISKNSTSAIKNISSNNTIQRDAHNRPINYLRRAISEIDPLSAIKSEVNKAIRDKKTFTVRGYQTVKKALLQRGWVEKVALNQRDLQTSRVRKFLSYSILELSHMLKNKEVADAVRRMITTKLLENHQVDFYWSYSTNAYKENSDKIKYTIINKFRIDIFNYTNKQGLCEVAKNSYWYQIPGISQINHPRTYSLAKNVDTKEFIHDFGITAAMSMLKWIVLNHRTKEIRVISPSGKIPIQAFEFAVNECCKFIKTAEHADIDEEIQDALEYEWHQFLEYFYKMVHIGHHFKKTGKHTDDSMANKASFVLDKLESHWPYLDMDGMMNIWILKPTSGCRGQGIHICRTLQYVLKTIKNHPNIRYIIQKYIEKPLLIYNTKFDIRQWFLISSSVPLTIWIYKDCYLRFSSQTYNLRKLHESIHLTNNAVQARYENKQAHDINLPSYNMWTISQFQTYLTNIGFPDVFKKKIYAGMKQSITAAILIHQDKIDKRPNSFELYGADFMVTEDFTPWLLEINSNPALGPTTPVTTKLCPEVLEDVIKVVIDHAKDNRASTGKFELIYKEKPSNNIRSQNVDLKLTGKPLKDEYFKKEVKLEETMANESFMNNTKEIIKYNHAQEHLKELEKELKSTMENLIKMIQQEKSKRQDTIKSINSDLNSSTDTMFTARTDSRSTFEEFEDAREVLSSAYLNSLEIMEPPIDNSRWTGIINFMETVINILKLKKQCL